MLLRYFLKVEEIERNEKWWLRLDLNQRPLPCQGSALPTELRDFKSNHLRGGAFYHKALLLFLKNVPKRIKATPILIITSAKLKIANSK